MKRINPYLLAWMIGSLSTQAEAEKKWSDFSVSWLQGDDYEVIEPSQQIITFEYAANHDFGDVFLFHDRLKADDGTLRDYSEFNFRWRLGEFSDSWINSYYVATTVEMGGVNNYLYGVGVDWSLPHFKYFKTNFYFRNNGSGGNSEQLTLTWAIPMGVFYYDGFIDWAGEVEQPAADRVSHMNFTSQLKYDLAPHFDLDNKLYLGIEYVFWNNKFGIDGVNERNVNLLLKWHL